MVQNAAAPALSSENELKLLTHQTAVDAAEFSRLERLTDAIQNNELSDELLEECPDLAAAFKKVEKLKYRKNMLQRALKKQLAENESKGKGNKA